MAPKAKEADGKQKTLLNFFTKGDAKAKPSPAKPAFKPKARQSEDAPTEVPRTPKSKRPSMKELSSSGPATSSTSSPLGTSSVHDTPPTSDPVDIDMDGEEEVQLRVRISVRDILRSVA